MSSYAESLLKAVIENSQSKSWHSAAREWTIEGVEEDEEASSVCICGKTGLRYLFTIHNFITGNTLFPIGSECIKKFEREDLYENAIISIDLFKLLHAIRDRAHIEPTVEFFTRKLIEQLFDKGAIDNEIEYEFFLKMYRKKDKDSITLKQQKWINKIIAFSIKPWLEANYGNRIRIKQKPRA